MIRWRKYDPERPPKSGVEYLISDGKFVDVAFFDDNLWFVPDISQINGSGAITHYAEINLPHDKAKLRLV
ncbi:hypothetical protein PP175_26335 (plasmid) [Aneurinibacillus sp. Ricciae_BoGa-3]|uniref:hypothetical protein n=1 Tax=Aneurinibacillus sp. Ricciae_BoGa-3 TaxID=3022697 RepID=UPI002341872C|nr:hypothetical protein [Aneurinibacillus sp. Ricciae_BoGa-3]WCK57586.1 hypothetical protein PP175_26335 [Aneurinibacillus sp. Ricciae_BoGa-3]